MYLPILKLIIDSSRQTMRHKLTGNVIFLFSVAFIVTELCSYLDQINSYEKFFTIVKFSHVLFKGLFCKLK
jgi:hypothetical protein